MQDYCFPKELRLLKRRHFQKINGRGRRRVGRHIVVDLTENSLSRSRLGITVTKKYGRAHDRNRFKRVVREAYRTTRGRLAIGIDFVVRPREAARTAKSGDIAKELLYLIGDEGVRRGRERDESDRGAQS